MNFPDNPIHSISILLTLLKKLLVKSSKVRHSVISRISKRYVRRTLYPTTYFVKKKKSLAQHSNHSRFIISCIQKVGKLTLVRRQVYFE